MHLYARNASRKIHKELEVVVTSGEENEKTGVRRSLTFHDYSFVPFNFITLSTSYLFGNTKTTVPMPLSRLLKSEFLKF